MGDGEREVTSSKWTGGGGARGGELDMTKGGSERGMLEGEKMGG